MHRRVAIGCIAGVSAAVLAPNAEAALPACNRAGETVVAGDLARVYKVPARRPPAEAFKPIAAYYGCDLVSGRRTKLGTATRAINAGVNVYGFRVAGRFVAYGRLRCDRFACSAVLVRKSLRTRSTKSVPLNPYYGYVWDLELKASGALAWIDGWLPTSEFRPPAEVHKLEGNAMTVLDSRSDQIDARSLALSGSTLYWTKSGQPHSASLD